MCPSHSVDLLFSQQLGCWLPGAKPAWAAVGLTLAHKGHQSSDTVTCNVVVRTGNTRLCVVDHIVKTAELTIIPAHGHPGFPVTYWITLIDPSVFSQQSI